MTYLGGVFNQRKLAFLLNQSAQKQKNETAL